jgi:hypothetical protein
MRRILVPLAVLTMVTLAFAQAPRALSPFEQDLINNENKFMQAFADKNVAYVNQSVADDFKGIATNGDFYDRDELVGMAHEGPPKGVRAYDFVVVRLDDGCAVVSYNMIVPGGRPRYTHMSDTWAKDNGRWKLKFQQTTTNLWSATDFD